METSEIVIIVFLVIVGFFTPFVVMNNVRSGRLLFSRLLSSGLLFIGTSASFYLISSDRELINVAFGIIVPPAALVFGMYLGVSLTGWLHDELESFSKVITCSCIVTVAIGYFGIGAGMFWFAAGLGIGLPFALSLLVAVFGGDREF